jgi:hypothetical protein
MFFCPLQKSKKLFHCALQSFAGRELGNLLGRNLDLFAGLGVPADAGLALSHAECPKAYEGNRLPLLHPLFNCRQHARDCPIRHSLASHDFAYFHHQVCLVQLSSPPLALRIKKISPILEQIQNLSNLLFGKIKKK